MFNLFKKKEKPRQPTTIRDTLFGDLPISEWPKDDNATAEPWLSFVEARNFINKNNKASAVAALQKIAEMPGLEPRHYLQAWHFLRQLGVNPPNDKAKIVYGVVFEIGMKNGADIVVAYTDYTARYLHHTGSGVIWEKPDHSLDAEIEALLKAGQEVVYKIGPWDQARPAPPEEYNVRLNMLTPSGLHFGYGGYKTLSADPMGNAIIFPAMQLIQGLTNKTKK